MEKKKKEIIRNLAIIGIVVLLAWIVSAESGQTEVEFSIVTTQPSCQINSQGDVSFWTWWDQVSGTVITDMIPPASCYKIDGWPSWGCCPDNIQCNPDTSTDHPGECYGIAPDICDDYNDLSDPESYCMAFNLETAIRSIERMSGVEGICSGDYPIPIIIGAQTCEQFTGNCRCYWDNVDDKCKATSTTYTVCGGTPSAGTCTQEGVTKDNQCIERGLITYIWEAVWTDLTWGEASRPAYCVNGTKTFSCNMMRLGFFSLMNIILCVLIIAVIYYFIHVSNKEEKSVIKN